MKTVDIKGKDYVMINERIKYFRSQDQYKGWSLTSDIISHENGKVLIRAIITDSEGRLMATGLAQEKEGDGFINKTSYIENCETSAWGRALGNMGIGIDASIASAEEVQNAQLNQQKPELLPGRNSWKEAIKYLQGSGAIETIQKKYFISESNLERLKQESL